MCVRTRRRVLEFMSPYISYHLIYEVSLHFKPMCVTCVPSRHCSRLGHRQPFAPCTVLGQTGSRITCSSVNLNRVVLPEIAQTHFSFFHPSVTSLCDPFLAGHF